MTALDDLGRTTLDDALKVTRLQLEMTFDIADALPRGRGSEPAVVAAILAALSRNYAALLKR